MKSIQAATVEREEGYWTHPDLPEWDEGVTRVECEAWAASLWRFGLNSMHLKTSSSATLTRAITISAIGTPFATRPAHSC